METLFSDWAIVSDYMETLFRNRAIVGDLRFSDSEDPAIVSVHMEARLKASLNGTVQRARVHFPATSLQVPAFWPTGAGELSASDPRAGPFWTEPVLRTRAFRLKTDWSTEPDRPDKLEMT